MALIPAGSDAASFDCSKATVRLDKLICSNQRLSRLDESLSQEYRNALAHAPNAEKIKAEQRAWAKSRNGCADAACLEQAYRSRITALRSSPAPTPVPPVEKAEVVRFYAGEGDSAVGQNQNGGATFVTSVTILGHDKGRLTTDRGAFFWAPWMPAPRVEAMQSMAEGLAGQRARITYSRSAAKGDEARCLVEAIARNIGFLERRGKADSARRHLKKPLNESVVP